MIPKLQKRELRNAILKSLRALNREHFETGGVLVANALLKWIGLMENPSPLNVGLFANLPDEIDTTALDRHLKDHNHLRFAPHFTQNGALEFFRLSDESCIADLQEGSYGISMPEPDAKYHVTINELDLMIVPGVAFDTCGHRLGRGKGYYDRYLARAKKKPILVGLALDEQMVSKIPVEPHDIPMDYVCTPNWGVAGAQKDQQ